MALLRLRSQLAKTSASTQARCQYSRSIQHLFQCDVSALCYLIFVLFIGKNGLVFPPASVHTGRRWSLLATYDASLPVSFSTELAVANSHSAHPSNTQMVHSTLICSSTVPVDCLHFAHILLLLKQLLDVNYKTINKYINIYLQKNVNVRFQLIKW